MDSNTTHADIRCTFCGMAHVKATTMIAGKDAHVCGGCVKRASSAPAMAPTSCTFCHESKPCKLTAGDGTTICAECVDIAADIVREQEKKDHAYAAAGDVASVFARAAAAALARDGHGNASPQKCTDSGSCACETCKSLSALWTVCTALQAVSEVMRRHPDDDGHWLGTWNPRATPLSTRRARLAAAAHHVARQHGQAMDIGSVTDEQIVHWNTVAKRDAEAAARKAREEAPLKESKERRRVASKAFAEVIPGAYAPVVPVEAGETEDDRKVNADALFSPDEFGRVRVKDKAAYAAAMEAAVAIANGKVRTVLLAGPSGAGKTHLAALMLRRITLEWERNAARGAVPELDPSAPPRHRPVDGDPVFLRLAASTGYRGPGKTIPGVTWQKASDMFRAAAAPKPFPKDGEVVADPLDAAKHTGVAVLEDIGREPYQANVTPVKDVMDDRYEGAGLVTIATTGFCDPEAAPTPNNPDDMRRFLARLLDRYDDAVVRRLSERGVAVVIPVGCKPAKGTARTAPQSGGKGARRDPSGPLFS